MRARFEVMLYLQGLESDFLEKTPEAMAIREIEEEVQAKATETLAKLEESREKEEKKEAKKPRKPRTTKTTRGRRPTKNKESSE